MLAIVLAWQPMQSGGFGSSSLAAKSLTNGPSGPSCASGSSGKGGAMVAAGTEVCRRSGNNGGDEPRSRSFDMCKSL